MGAIGKDARSNADCGALCLQEAPAGLRTEYSLAVITWGEQIDIALETLYAEATGRGLPDWVETEENTPAK